MLLIIFQQDHASRLKRQNMAFDEHTAQLDAAHLEQLAVIDSDEEGDQKPPRMQPTPNQCYVSIGLTGPISPLEAKVFGAYGNALNQNVTIEPQSVNSVLLDDRSQVISHYILLCLDCFYICISAHQRNNNAANWLPLRLLVRTPLKN